MSLASSFFQRTAAEFVFPHLFLTAVGTAAMILCLATSIVGWAGIFLNNRAFLTVYATLLWPAFALVVAPGYITYKKRAFNLDGKINNLWSRLLTIDERRQIQLAFSCCGYYSPYVEASADSFRCFARSLLPGCKGPFMKFQSEALMIFYAASFAIVPVHLFCIIVALLCSDHVTYRFGKGITPKAYRLDEDAIADMKSVSLLTGLSRLSIHVTSFPLSASSRSDTVPCIRPSNYLLLK